ncbi:MarR family winged helix-turn-helix transcriptional regulator [Roseibium marinum]|uniref:DNA-binding MarR family transcriptional regulator n=1 Tax=Roseibium marinum TaxID=281252 RepID=A0A2S3V4L9_9HYPH|nr:MarR family transcriptional regulator [Roseibium marinum]POF34865.1 DNA-binding MarR family transcriptional regulator [Roseibium marinum]
MVEDVVRTLGYATLGSRLKRIGEKLQAQTQELTEGLAGTDLPVPHNPVLAALDLHGPLSIGDLTKALGQSQPGVTRMVNRMKSDGLVEARSDDKDGRVSRISLTQEGERLVAHLKATLWPAAFLAVQEACAGLEGPLLDQLAQLEDALSEKPLIRRKPVAPLPHWSSFSPSEEENR